MLFTEQCDGLLPFKERSHSHVETSHLRDVGQAARRSGP